MQRQVFLADLIGQHAEHSHTFGMYLEHFYK